MADTKRLILKQLADGKRHGGNAMADQLGISRAAVWKHIKALKTQGLTIESDNANGYCIPGGLQLLDQEVIAGMLTHNSDGQRIEVLESVNSTNDYLLNLPAKDLHSGMACIAERQTSGRGTRGRTWVSPYGTNLYLSFFWHFERSPLELGGLSLAVAAVLCDVLRSAGALGVGIKWPNDLYIGSGKLGGILLDMTAEVNGPSRVVIGVGLNHGMPELQQEIIDQEAADLRDTNIGSTMDRNQLAALFIDALYECCGNFAEHGFNAFQELWRKHDIVLGQQVQLISGNEIVSGLATGVNEMGALELETSFGRKTFASGDVSLRVAS